MMTNKMSERSWLRSLRLHFGWTEQPAKYISGFIYGFVIGLMLCMGFVVVLSAFGLGPTPGWVPLLGATQFGILIGFCQ